MNSALRIENLSKRYFVDHEARHRQGAYRTMRESLADLAAAPLRRLRGERRATREEFWALRDVSFDVQPGEAVGIIGRNGAGKSTLLKILSRITKPTAGRVRIQGRIGSLLEVGTGFHPELTGRENVYLNGSILGMTGREIARRFDEIAAFAEIDQFLDTPVKRYSSGMYVRLAFAVAAHLEPEILIVDEVLAVGDAGFQKKCVTRLRDLSRSGCAVLFVSHNLAVVERLCSRAAYLDRGRVVSVGPSQQQVQHYLGHASRAPAHTVNLTDHPSRARSSTPLLAALRLSSRGTPRAVVQMGDSITLEVTYNVNGRPRDLRVGIIIEDAYGTKIGAASPTFQDPHLLDNAPTSGTLTAAINELTLVPGTYSINLYAYADGATDAIEGAALLEVEAADVGESDYTLDRSIASTYFPCTWNLAPDLLPVLH